jgi:hypothetical protein
MHKREENRVGRAGFKRIVLNSPFMSSQASLKIRGKSFYPENKLRLSN